MATLRAAAAAALMIGLAQPVAANPAPDLSGVWTVTAKLDEGTSAAQLSLTHEGEAWSGHSSSLDLFAPGPLDYRGSISAGRLHLEVRSGARLVGSIDLVPKGSGLAGFGKLFGAPVTIVASRPEVPTRPPTVLDYQPTEFHPLTSAVPAPVLRLVSGDTVRTRTVDAFGADETGAPASIPGNPGTGPFYVVGAMPGDTVAIQIISLKPNRSTARMGGGVMDYRALPSGYQQTPGDHRDNLWKIDTARGVVSVQDPSAKLKDFTVPLRPMLGVVSVAFPDGLTTPNSDLGEWGGNLDYPEVREGVTLYLPVYQVGAYIYLGDAHARQGAGEVAGGGLETSMAVEFKVTLIPGHSMPQPWAENAEYVMVSGIGGSLDAAAQRATAGLARWLKATYALDDSEVAAVLGSSLEYDIAEVVDPKVHVVAKVRKDFLAQIGRGP